MFARNPWSSSFGSRVAFADLCGAQTSWTGDRREFIGRNGTLADPAALSVADALSKTVGAGLDPCAALSATIELPPGDLIEVIFFLGEAENEEAARGLVTRYRAADLDAVETDVERQWDEILGSIVVKTPDRSMDVMLNGWLLYQTLSCRFWARSAFYQASGAYGFRDQLQDGMALAMTRPMLTRDHLLRAAARQFVEGDVQHWWLPHSGQGVRTRISDDRPWLAYAVAHYVDATGDFAILDERVPFLEGQTLEPGEHDSFFNPTVSDQKATRVRALRSRARRLTRAGHPWASSDGDRRLERRHEPRRRKRPRRKRLARLVPPRGVDGLHSDRRDAPGNGQSRRHGARTPPLCEPRSKTKHGMENGIAAPFSTTASR